MNKEFFRSAALPHHSAGFSSHVKSVFCLMTLLTLFLAIAVFWRDRAAAQTTEQVNSATQPVYRIPLRVHLAASSRPPEKFKPIFEEINRIWFSQARICFEIKTVMDNTPLQGDGFDLWFAPDIGVLNGYFDGESLRVRDTPRLAPARNPSKDPTARTTAHELGHALGLGHRQDSDENLMRSKTFGWQLNEDEIQTARRNAAAIGRLIAAASRDSCSPR